MTTEQAELRYHRGVGVRYQLTKNYPLHMRLDYAWGRDGPLFYFGLSEAY